MVVSGLVVSTWLPLTFRIAATVIGLPPFEPLNRFALRHPDVHCGEHHCQHRSVVTGDSSRRLPHEHFALAPSTRHFPHGAWSFSGWPHVHIILASEGSRTQAGPACLVLAPGTLHAGPPTSRACEGSGQCRERSPPRQERSRSVP